MQLKNSLKYKVSDVLSVLRILVIVGLGFSGVYVIGKFSLFIVVCALYMGLGVIEYKKVIIPTKFELLLTISLFLSFFLNFGHSKQISFVFTLVYLFGMISVWRRLTMDELIKGIKIVFFGFFIVTVLATILTPILGLGGEDLLSRILGVIFEPKVGRLRYFALSTEPSYAGIITSVSFLGLNLYGKLNKRMTLITWGMFLFMLARFSSGFGMIVGGMVILYVTIIPNLKQIQKNWYKYLLIIPVGFLFILSSEAVTERIGVILEVFTKGSLIEQVVMLNEVDSSTFYRIAPVAIYLLELKSYGISAIIGHGAAASSYYFTEILQPYDDKDALFPAAFLPGFMYDYGVVSFGLTILAFLKFKIKSSISWKLLSVFLFLVISLNSNFNTNLFWFVLTVINIPKFSAGN